MEKRVQAFEPLVYFALGIALFLLAGAAVAVSAGLVLVIMLIALGIGCVVAGLRRVAFIEQARSAAYFWSLIVFLAVIIGALYLLLSSSLMEPSTLIPFL